jgi:Reverse transcriptase (RNA-dependent DNA polymerase)
MSEILDQVVSVKHYTKIDLYNAYHRICIRSSDKWKTALCIWYGQFKYQVLSFDLANTSVTFQIYMNQSLQGLINIIYIVYLNDILIFSVNLEDHY